MGDGGMAGYVATQMRLATAMVAEPHMLIPLEEEDQHYMIVSSVAGLDNALDASGIATGYLLVQALPTATLSDCREIRDAAEAREYRGLEFELLTTPEADDPVRAKLASNLDVTKARRDIGDAATKVAALAEKLSRLKGVPQETRARPESRRGAATRASKGAQQWEEFMKRPTQEPKRLMFAVDRLRSIGASSLHL